MIDKIEIKIQDMMLPIEEMWQHQRGRAEKMQDALSEKYTKGYYDALLVLEVYIRELKKGVCDENKTRTNSSRVSEKIEKSGN